MYLKMFIKHFLDNVNEVKSYNNIVVIIINVQPLPHYSHNDPTTVNWTIDIHDYNTRRGCIWYSTS